jgi:hypothetical protein
MARKYTKKPRQIKPWPSLCGLNSFLLKSPDVNDLWNSFHLDFSQVYNVDSLGLVIFLSKLVQTKTLLPGSIFSLSLPESPTAAVKLESLGIGYHCSRLGLIQQIEKSLFEEQDSVFVSAEEQAVLKAGSTMEVIHSIIPDPKRSRAELLHETKSLIKKFLKLDKKRNFNHEQILLALAEMIKNTLDHSDQPALLGLSTQLNSDNSGKFSFSYCDTGEGICKTVRQFLDKLKGQFKSDPNQLFTTFPGKHFYHLSEKGSFSDLLHWALQPGNSTKSGNGVNFGLGLTLISEASKNCGIRLFLKDADSMWNLKQLSPPYSHTEIRRLVIPTSAPNLMMFYGELEF